uniref:UDP-glycosyltransferase 76H1-like n=1 Tax=Erigeron canadensis TaxID=72917 RepID=UPI001CB8BE97|nr:UDP-glycosyltransferase 76H1-like [Erigeron canadensis]
MPDQGRKRCRLVLLASPLQGHMTPLLQLGTYLHSKGFLITIAHSEFNRPDPSNHPNFIFLPLCDNLSATDISSGIGQVVKVVNDNCKPHLLEYLIRVINAQKDTYEKETIVIIHDNLMYFAASVARELGLPNIILRSSSATFFPAIMMIPQLHQQGRLPVQGSLLQETILELYPLRYKDLPFIGLPVEAALQLINLIIPQISPVAFVWNTLEFLEQPALTKIRNHYQVPVFTVGPLHKIIPTPSTSFIEEDISCISWLDKQEPKSVIYVSLGSLANVDEKVSIEMAWGLANSNQPFLWVVRPSLVTGFEWIEFLPEDLVAELKTRGLIVKWAPQKEVLAHNAVGGFWSHCGWNSTLESLSAGVPLLCQPFEVDQKVNSRYLSYVWKIGVEIVMERAEIASAIRSVLVGKEGEEMRQRAIEIQEKAQVAYSNCGSSQNSLNDLVEFIWSL